MLAIRLAALEDDEKYEQAAAFNNTTRYYGAFRFDPKLFGKDSHTSIRGNFEHGKQTSDNPRDIPPDDEITPWFKTGTDAYGNPGLNKLTENQFSLTNPVPGVGGTTVLVPGASGGPESQNYFQLGGNAQGRTYWPDVINYYEATPGNQQVGTCPLGIDQMLGTRDEIGERVALVQHLAVVVPVPAQLASSPYVCDGVNESAIDE